MKGLFLFLLVFVFLVPACNKDNPVSTSTGLVGQWTWIRTCGGFSGACYTPESTHKNGRVDFTADSIYYSFREDTLQTSSRFHVRLDSANAGTITYEDSRTQSFLIKGEILILDDGCCDQYISEYKRVKAEFRGMDR